MASPASQVSSTPATATTPTAVSAGGPQQQIIRATGGVAAWSGETHPALAQVPRTPQQIQHMQRLQLQRQQQMAAAAGGGPTAGGAGGGAVTGGPGGAGVADPNNPDAKAAGVVVSGAGDMQQQQQQHVMIGPNGQSQTKVALQNMLSSRLGPGGQPLPPGAAGPQQGGPGGPPGTVVQQTPGMNFVLEIYRI